MSTPTPMTDKPKRLGRGLEALIATATPPHSATVKDATTASSPLQSIPVDRIRSNPFQPRSEFGPIELVELENSIRISGLLQPVTVRALGEDGFELVTGERRLRAVRRLGWTEVPALVKPIDDRAMLTLALIENLQRTDLNPIDEALGYRRLVQEFSLTQQQVAESVGKDRSTVANLLRILQLPEGVTALVRSGTISLGHARALLGMPNEIAVLDAARRIADEELTVRDIERLAQALRAPPPREQTARTSAPPHPTPAEHTAELRRQTELLRRRFQTDVRITMTGPAKGEIALRFYSADDLQRLMELILGESLHAL